MRGIRGRLSKSKAIKEYSSNLPQTTKFIEIPGSNHTYFGVNGSQSGGNEAQITVEEQQAVIIESIGNWVNDVDGASQVGT